MKNFFVWCSVALNVVLLVILLAKKTVHTEQRGDQKITTLGKFSVLEQMGLTTNQYVVFFDSGRFFWTIEGNLISVNCGLYESASLRVDPDNGRVKSTVVELLGGDSKAMRIIDFNADGIPDKRQFNGVDGFQVFFKGQFHDSSVEGTNRYIIIDGKRIKVRFTDDRWATED